MFKINLFPAAFILFVSLLSCAFMAKGADAAVTSDGSKPVYKPEALEEIVRAVEKCVTEGTTPVVVFDLDSTLMNNAPRNRTIIKEFAEKNKDKYPELYKASQTMKDEQMAYALEDSLKNIGVNDEKTLKDLKKYWYDTFFTDKYVTLDSAYEGAADYVNKLHAKGAKIVYLTGRDTPDMEKGTIQSLKDQKIPIGDPNSFLMTKPEKKTKDDQFKEIASIGILKMGKVLASFDNEPKNVNLSRKTFPGAMTIFVETNHSPKAVPVEAGIPWIKSWK